MTRSRVTQALNQFNKIVKNNNFPCLFGKRATRSELVFIAICIFKAESEYADLKSILEEYTSFVKLLPVKDRILSPLVVFFDPKFNTHKNAHQIGWDALNWVHVQDKASWPKDIPEYTKPERSKMVILL
ncbi:MAG: hypothetical protein EKK54_12245 [Neisseriaceae bacterium]|nr:MAG: hypothetical protein EKK54_12245 [Neisseriaceae bacterium]